MGEDCAGVEGRGVEGLDCHAGPEGGGEKGVVDWGGAVEAGVCMLDGMVV